MLLKAWQLARWQRTSRAFALFFWQQKDFQAIEAGLTAYRPSPLVDLFEAGRAGPEAADQLNRVLRRRADEAVRRVESSVAFLATPAATTPFIGLFGTVWGIMEAFGKIGASGSTALSIVAPGISEALVATAVGLVVAIPAVVGYNALQGPIRQLTAEIDHFCDDFIVLRGR